MKESEHIDICECDVEDKESLALYRKKRAEWINWLQGDKEHSIQKQISSMLWDDAIYRTFGQIFEIYPENNNEDIGYVPSLMNLLIRDFLDGQSIKIRKLTDPLNEQSSRAVISLRALIEDVAKHNKLITRENYVCFDGKKYDTTQMQLDEMNRNFSKGKKTYWGSKEVQVPIMRHKAFDRITEKTEKDRSRKDIITRKAISNINKFKECGHIRTYVNKFIVHASTAENRERLKTGEILPTLDKFDKCYKEIAKAAWLITDVVSDGIAWQVPTPQFEVWENLDKPMAKKEDINKLKKYWQQRCIEIENIRNN